MRNYKKAASAGRAVVAKLHGRAWTVTAEDLTVLEQWVKVKLSNRLKMARRRARRQNE